MERVTTVGGLASGSAGGEELYHLKLLALLQDLVLAPEGPARHPEEAYQAPASAVGARCTDPGDMAEIAAGSVPGVGAVKNVNTFGKWVPGVLPRWKGSLILILLSGFFRGLLSHRNLGGTSLSPG